MRNVAVLFVIGLLFFSFKSESAIKEEIKEVYQAEVAIYKVLEQEELIDVIKTAPNYSKKEEIAKDLIKQIRDDGKSVANNDIVKIAESFKSLNIDESFELAFLPWINGKSQILVYKSTPLIRENVQMTKEYKGDNGCIFPFKFSDEKLWAKITQENVGCQLALSVNGKIVNAPRVASKIEGGQCSALIGDKIEEFIELLKK